MEWHVDEYAKRIEQAPENITTIFNGERRIVYALLDFCKTACLYAQCGAMEFKQIVANFDLTSKKDIIIHTLAAHAMVRDWEEGVYHEDPAKNEVFFCVPLIV